MIQRLDRDRYELAAEALMHYPFQVWWFGDSIGLEGLLAAADVLGRPAYQAWAHGLIKGWIPRATPFREIDNTAPGHAILQAFERVHDAALLTIATELCDYLRSRRLLRGAYVTFEHSPLHAPYGGAPLASDELELLETPGAGVFVDCMHFDPPFFAHLGSIHENDELLDIAADQLVAYIGLLQSPDGIFSHFWLENTARAYGYGWGRGQGWALLGLVDVLERLPPSHPHHATLLDSFTTLGRALAETQRDDGGWPTVIHEPETPSETSTAAFAAAGFARGVALGLLGDDYAAKATSAWAHAASALDGTGKVGGISTAVWPSTHPSHYLNVPTGDLVPWGQGPFLLATKRLRDLGLIGAPR